MSRWLWPESAQADRRGWLLRELVILAVASAGAAGSLALAVHTRNDGAEITVVSVLLLGLAVAALPFRHRFPTAVLLVAFGATVTYWSFFARGPVFVPLVVSLGQVVLLGRRRTAIAVLVAGFVGFPWLGVVVDDYTAPTPGQIVGLAAWLAFLLSVMEVIRSRSDRAREAARSQAEALRRRATEERLQIARELHDVVAHNMSLISIQAGVALHLLDQRPEQARESLATIKEASKEALVELRSILGVLRQVDEPDEDERAAEPQGGDSPGGTSGSGTASASAAHRAVGGGAGDDIADAAPRSPVPGLHRLDSLVKRARTAGLDVQVDTDVDVRGLPRNVDLAAYRIIQESLTNVARHSDDKAATVRMRLEGGALSVDILDEGTESAKPSAVAARSGPPTRRGDDQGQLGDRARPNAAGSGAGGDGPGPGAGHGIVGMRERAASVGGRLEAGPRPGRGFAVRAWLPLGGSEWASQTEEPR